ncbi:MAG: DEAD/DEAH box helicase [Acidimicrobiia bacterium]|nr:DEAD/DEAH box helicase [Acidimicrobiia bacterium]
MKRDDFTSTYGFALDPFQIQALDALDADTSVLVAAPTGSGKTVVAEYAVAKALAEGSKAFYTTPLKALSNQKYTDLARRHGSANVGLLTGDNAVNGEAPAVVMTTEVLRNMIYAGSSSLDGLRYVVLDEVHYLQNAYRGPVWEEVIIHLPPEVILVCLSATVSNAEEFADWVATVRGETAAIIEERRPVELHHLYLVGDRQAEALHLLPTFVNGRPNPEAARLDSRSVSGGRDHPERGRDRGRPRGRLYTPRRAEAVERLHAESMLPAIFFIFSRAACDDAVRQCLDYGLRLTSPDERTAIRAIAEAKAERLSGPDLDVLAYRQWLSCLESGLAAHHAGMVPPFKEAVEACFTAGLVKVVFATETLALGVNMPARSVVIEKLSKFTGERHEFLTPGEYTQITGRAGRRGIDPVGYATVLWSPFVPFDQVAGLASTRTYALSSSFRPTYNMAANLVRRYAPETARHLLNLSFAQYGADRDVVRLEAQVDKTLAQREQARAAAVCERGDVEEYRRLVRDLNDLGPSGPRSGGLGPSGPRRRGPPPAADPAEVAAALGRLRPGDVIVLSGGKSAGSVVVLSTGQRRGGDVRLSALTADRRHLTLSLRDFPAPPRAVARIELPSPFAPRNPVFQRTVARSLARTPPSRTPPSEGAPTAVSGEDGPGGPRRSRSRALAGAVAAVETHAVASCPDARSHLRAADRAERLDKDRRRLERRIQGRTESLARQFDRVLRILEAWGYVDGWSLTDPGHNLSRIWHECDLLVAEALRTGVFDGLDPTSVAALASSFTFEMRSSGPRPEPWFPSARVRRRWTDLSRLATELNQAEDEAGLPLTRMPDPGFFAAAYGWAAGEDLGEVIADEEMSGGDFVRNVKQLIDLLRQIGEVATEPATAKNARDAADRLFRGVVAVSSVVGA